MTNKCRLIVQRCRLSMQKCRLIVTISRGKRKGLTILTYIRECFHSLNSFKHSLRGITLGFLEPRLSPLIEKIQVEGSNIPRVLRALAVSVGVD